jgi:outer membrane protein TolC
MQHQFRWLGTLELGLFRESAAAGMSFTGPNAVIELPLFDQHQAQLLAADAEYRTARRTLDQLTQTALADLRTHAAEVTATRALVEKYRDAVLPNQQQLATQLGAGGEAAAIERFHLQQAILATEEQSVGLLRDYWRARGALARSAGDWAGLGD